MDVETSMSVDSTEVIVKGVATGRAAWVCACSEPREASILECEACGRRRPPFRVYLIVNMINGKRYVGYTHKKLEVRWRGHCSKKSTCFALRNAIQRYGRENFSRVEIEWCDAAASAKSKEIYWIRTLETRAPNGYNMTDGGEGLSNPSIETRLKLARASTGHLVSRETRAAVGAANRGREISDETRKKLSEASRNCSDEKRASLSAANKARYERAPESAETREKKAAAARAAWATGRHSAPLSEETRKKLSAARLKRGPLSKTSREKLSIAVKAGKAKSPMSPEGRAKIVEASRARMKTCVRDERGRIVQDRDLATTAGTTEVSTVEASFDGSE